MNSPIFILNVNGLNKPTKWQRLPHQIHFKNSNWLLKKLISSTRKKKKPTVTRKSVERWLEKHPLKENCCPLLVDRISSNITRDKGAFHNYKQAKSTRATHKSSNQLFSNCACLDPVRAQVIESQTLLLPTQLSQACFQGQSSKLLL